MITAVTPTGDRLHQFEICYELIMRQTVKPDRWIIIDDGVKKLNRIFNGKINNMELILIKREACPDRITLKENIFAALDKINIQDKILFFEDDDFYPNTYVETMCEFLNDYIVAGGLLRKYYNLNFLGYWEFKRPTFATLNSTAFVATDKILKILYEICANNSDGYDWDVDVEFWNEIQTENISNILHSDPGAQVIGVKGWDIGRRGAVIRTHQRSRRKYVYDRNLKMLDYYFGEMSGRYRLFIRHGFLLDIWRPTIGTFYRLRNFLRSRRI